jgi:LPPG:FO 2-phospho-L-lactate transferase
MIAVLCGGVGAARMLRALAEVTDPSETVAIVNTADDTTMHGLAISPDLDTVVYTLAGAIDPDRGWGLAGETWLAMASLNRFEPTRPASSKAGATWFNLGDRDLGTHLYRTGRLHEGATLTEVTAEIAAAFGLRQVLLPMTDQPVRTIVTLANGSAGQRRDVPFQEYFVRLRHDVRVSAVRFDGADVAAPGAAVLDALSTAATIIIAPSNPLVSIAPIRALAGVDDLLARRRDKVVAVSPIVGGAAIKGPADRMLVELGLEPSVVGVARLYAPIADALVIDPVDAHLADEVASAGIRAVIVPSVMKDRATSAALASATLAAITG